MSTRKIIHIDADCFFASIEMRDNPALIDVPIAIGSDGVRGVVATCNYPARSYGVHSAMSSVKAKQKCPQLLFIRGRMTLYKEVSRAMMAIMSDYTDTMEVVSVDEAFLDVTDTALFEGSATRIAADISARIKQELGITVSAGVSSNKLVAKIASDQQKPEGLTVVPPHHMADFIEPLALRVIPGVGRVTAQKLAQAGYQYCGDLRAADTEQLQLLVGQFGLRLAEYVWGRDSRPLKQGRLRKSCSVERTFSEDIHIDAVAAQYDELLARLKARIKPHEMLQISALVVKVKYFDFSQITAEQQANELSLELFHTLVETAWKNRQKAVRLLGFGVRFNRDPSLQNQLSLPF